MKNTLFCLTLLFLISCSVQKRKYQKGFYVARTHHHNNIQKASPASDKRAALKPGKSALVLSGDRVQEAALSPAIEPSQIKKEGVYLRTEPDTCDVLLFKDGSEIRAKVTEVSSTDVKYKRCDNLNGPSYVTRKTDLFMVKYANGSKEVMKSEPEVIKELPVYQSPRYTRKKAVMHPLSPFALALGIMSIVVSYAIFILALDGLAISPVIFAIAVLAALAALITGKVATNAINESDGTYKGKGLAVPGIIMGIVMLGIWAMILLIILLFTI